MDLFDPEMPDLLDLAVDSREREHHSVPPSARGHVEFDLPNPHGPRRRFRTLDLSSEGRSFALRAELVGIHPGDELFDVLIAIGEATVDVRLTLSQVTPSSETARVCGGRLFPASDADASRLAGVLAGLAEPPPF